jgi:cytochrome b561
MTTNTKHFVGIARLLHWLMAAMILTMLFIGVGMVSTVSVWHDRLVGLHKPLGIAVLILVLLRIAVRLLHRAPPLPADLSPLMKLGAHLSHLLLYALMVAMPLIGWAMLSAGGYPIKLFGSTYLPSMLAANPVVFARLHLAHTWLAYLLFATVMAHFAAALFHGLVRRDGVLSSMARSGK